MRAAMVTIGLALALGAGACAGGGSKSAGPASTGANAGIQTPRDPAKPCALLTAADFRAAGVAVDKDGEDVSANFTLATTTSAACQWTNFGAGARGGSWELVIGRGDASSAYKNAAPFPGTSGVKRLSLGDDSYFVDKVFQLDQTHSFEVGVRTRDTMFTLSTTDSEGARALQALATTVTARVG